MVYNRYSANDITSICKSLKVFQIEIPNKFINEDENKTTLLEHYDKQIQVSLSAFDLYNENILNDKICICYIYETLVTDIFRNSIQTIFLFFLYR